MPARFRTVPHGSARLYRASCDSVNGAEPCQPGPPHLAVPARFGTARFDFVVRTESNRAVLNACAFAVKMANWTEDETLCLITLWGEDSIQAQIEGCRRNRAIFAKLAEQMRDQGYNRTGDQCREKVKKLKADYKKIKDKNNETGRARQSSRVFEAMNNVLGHRPATHPHVVLDTSDLEGCKGSVAYSYVTVFFNQPSTKVGI